MAMIMSRQGQGSEERRGYQPQDSGSQRVPYGVPDGYRPQASGSGEIVPPPADAIAGDVPAHQPKPDSHSGQSAPDDSVSNG